MTVRRELRRGLRATAPYLLSHHVADERDRCHRVAVGDCEVHLCARCAGIYPGLALGLLWGLTRGLPSGPALPVAVALLPAPALLDWASSALRNRDGSNWLRNRDGSNWLRTATGVLIGIGYALGLVGLWHGHWWVLGVGVAYGLAALALLREAD